MNTSNTLLLLDVTTSPSAVPTSRQLFEVLEISGIVRSRDGLLALRFAADQLCATQPATVLGFVQALHTLAKLHPDYPRGDSAKLAAYIKQASASGTDEPLTYSTLLALLESLPSATPAAPKPETTTHAATSRR